MVGTVERRKAHAQALAALELLWAQDTAVNLVIVGKQGWKYLVQDPARPPDFGVYPLKRLVPHIDALRYFRVIPADFMIQDRPPGTWY